LCEKSFNVGSTYVRGEEKFTQNGSVRKHIRSHPDTLVDQGPCAAGTSWTGGLMEMGPCGRIQNALA